MTVKRNNIQFVTNHLRSYGNYPLHFTEVADKEAQKPANGGVDSVQYAGKFAYLIGELTNAGVSVAYLWDARYETWQHTENYGLLNSAGARTQVKLSNLSVLSTFWLNSCVACSRFTVPKLHLS